MLDAVLTSHDDLKKKNYEVQANVFSEIGNKTKKKGETHQNFKKL